MSYDLIHSINNRAQPTQILKYKVALKLFNIYRYKIPTYEWLAQMMNKHSHQDRQHAL
jgi:hypothetical protein